jgi:hypothetical protein
MTVAHDIYAETNPAFCTYALVNFTQSYLSVNANGPEQGDSVKSGITRRTSPRPCSCRPGTVRLLGLERARRISIF